MPRIPFVPLIVMLVGVCVLFLPLWPNPERYLWADNFDGYLIVWILEWGHHVLFENFQPSHFWQANSFFPHANSLAFSESLLSAQIFYGPLRQLGLGQLTSMYATFGLTIVVAGFLTDFGLRRLQFTVGERVVFLLVAHFSLPIVSFLYHFQMFGFQFIPAILVWTYLFFSKFDRLSFHISIGLYLVASCYSTYLVIAIPVIALPGIIYLLSTRIKENGWRSVQADVRPATSVFWLMCYLALLYLILLKPYLHLGTSFELPTYDDIRVFSAKPSSLFKGRSIHSLWYNPGGYGFGGWERAYFPGYALLSVCLAVLVVFVTKGKNRSEQEYLPSKLMIVAALTFFWAYLLSLGPFLRGTNIPLPYWVISEVVPAFRNIRTPGRFGTFLTFPLAVFCIFMLRYSSRFFQGRASILAFLMTLTIGIESLPKFRVFDYAVEGDEDFASLKAKINEGDPLIVIPSAADEHMQTILRVTHQLIGSRHHWGRMVVGYGSKDTIEMQELLDRERRVNSGVDSLKSFIEFAQKLGVKYIFIRSSSLTEKARDIWLKDRILIENVGSEEIGRNILLRL